MIAALFSFNPNILGLILGLTNGAFQCQWVTHGFSSRDLLIRSTGYSRLPLGVNGSGDCWPVRDCLR